MEYIPQRSPQAQKMCIRDRVREGLRPQLPKPLCQGSRRCFGPSDYELFSLEGKFCKPVKPLPVRADLSHRDDGGRMEDVYKRQVREGSRGHLQESEQR